MVLVLRSCKNSWKFIFAEFDIDNRKASLYIDPNITIVSDTKLFVDEQQDDAVFVYDGEAYAFQNCIVETQSLSEMLSNLDSSDDRYVYQFLAYNRNNHIMFEMNNGNYMINTKAIDILRGNIIYTDIKTGKNYTIRVESFIESLRNQTLKMYTASKLEVETFEKVSNNQKVRVQKLSNVYDDVVLLYTNYEDSKHEALEVTVYNKCKNFVVCDDHTSEVVEPLDKDGVLCFEYKGTTYYVVECWADSVVNANRILKEYRASYNNDNYVPIQLSKSEVIALILHDQGSIRVVDKNGTHYRILNTVENLLFGENIELGKLDDKEGYNVIETVIIPTEDFVISLWKGNYRFDEVI